MLWWNLFILTFTLCSWCTSACSFSCSIQSKLEKIPFYTGPWCSNDPTGWAHGRVSLIKFCGMSCSQLNDECNDNPRSPDGIMPQVLNRDFADCCDDNTNIFESPPCTFCPYGLINPDHNTTVDLFDHNARLKLSNFTATCAEIEYYYDNMWRTKTNKSPSISTCPKLRSFLSTRPSSTGTCECQTAAPTISPAPSTSRFPSSSPSITFTPSNMPTKTPPSPDEPCVIQNSDYSKPGWKVYGIMSLLFIVFFAPTIVIYLHLRNPSAFFVCSNIFLKLIGDLDQVIFLTINVYLLMNGTDIVCDKKILESNIVVTATALGTDLISDILAASTIRKLNINIDDDFEIIKWKGMEFCGGWIVALFCTISLIGTSVIGMFGLISQQPSDSSLTNNTFNTVVWILILSQTPVGLALQPIYGSLYDPVFSWGDYCKQFFTPCSFGYITKRNTWRNKSTAAPHAGPVWGGAERIFLEYTSSIYMLCEILLNIDANAATLSLLITGFVARVTRIFFHIISICECCE